MDSLKHDDEVDLIEVALVLWNGKWLIILASFLCLAVGLSVAFLKRPVYESTAVLAPKGADALGGLADGLGGLVGMVGLSEGATTERDKAIATLGSRVLIEDFIRDENLLPILFDEKWDEAAGAWNVDSPEDVPTLSVGVETFISNVRRIEANSPPGFVTLSMRWYDPELAASWLQTLIRRVNDRMRRTDMHEAQQRIAYLNEELRKANLVELRQAIASLIESQIETVMLTQAEADYAFEVIDPPRVPIEHVSPNRLLFGAISLIAGVVIGASFVLVRWILSNRLERVT